MLVLHAVSIGHIPFVLLHAVMYGHMVISDALDTFSVVSLLASTIMIAAGCLRQRLERRTQGL